MMPFAAFFFDLWTALLVRWSDFKLFMTFWIIKHLVPRYFVYWSMVYAGGVVSTTVLSDCPYSEITLCEEMNAWDKGAKW